ncbi:hypothetical protein NQ314_004050 [Rhamnusium bicolor]|uniref:Glycogen debranching enzyme n=1 Tax=Rhamnusium bicolor TaxID=1586634 RepID=A0AAV8ZLM3_9CUCU|nr:hypothetical protein NQ314_004050 [Rhamnusium bicolor]
MIIGTREDTPNTTVSSKASSKDSSKLKSTKPRQNTKKTHEEPAFSTNLSTPIEDIIEETITEEIKKEVKQTSTSRKKGKSKSQDNKEDNEGISKSNRKQNKEEGNVNIGYSFFKPETSETVKSETILKTKLRTFNSTSSKVNEDESLIDDIGFSFLPVKEKGKKSKNKSLLETKDSKENLNTVQHSQKKTKEDLPKSSIIDHYKKRASRQTVIETVPAVTNNSLEKVQHFASLNKLEEKQQLENKNRSEYRESKKVSSSISYANVLTNNIPEKEDDEDINLDTYKTSEKAIDIKSINPFDEKLLTEKRKYISFETNSEDRDLDITFEKVQIVDNIQQFKIIEEDLIQKVQESSKVFDSSIPKPNLEKNLSKSSTSSSIEVISEPPSEQNSIDYQNIQLQSFVEKFYTEEVPKQFDIGESIVNSDPVVKQFSELKGHICSSESSSICVLDSRSETEEISNKEEAQVDDHFQSVSNATTQKQISSEVEDSLPNITEKPFVQFQTEYSTHSDSDSVDAFIFIGKDSEEKNIPLEESSIFSDQQVDTQLTKADDVSLQKDLQLLETLVKFSEELSQELCHSEKTVDKQSEYFKLDNFCDTLESQAQEKTDPIVFAPEPSFSSLGSEKKVETESLKEHTPPEITEEVVETFQQLGETSEEKELQVSKDYFKRDYSRSPQFVEKLKYFEEYSKQTEISPLSVTTAEIKSVQFLPFLETNEYQTTEHLVDKSSNNSYIDRLKDQTIPVVEESQQGTEKEKCVKEFSYITGNTFETLSITENKSNQELKMASTQQIRILTLNNQEHQECTLYRIEKHWAIQFRLGPTLFGRKVNLYCNYPVESNGDLSGFNRDKYQLLTWKLDEGCKNADDTAAYTQITTKLSGSFHYYFTYESGNSDRPVIVELGKSNSSYSLSEQLKVNPIFKKESGEIPTFEEIEQFIAKIRKEWKITSICDIVLNHTANESQWIKEHPEVTYNCVNCPYMRPAYLLDAAFYQFSLDVERGLYEDRGIPIEVNHEDHLNAIRYHFRISVLEPLKLEELYICDVNKLVAEFLNFARNTAPNTRDIRKISEELKLLQDPEYKRLSGKVDMALALKLYNVYWNDTFDEESRLKRCAEEFKNKLDAINHTIIEKVNDHLASAVENVIAGIRYFRVQTDGPRIKEITKNNPLVYRYFTDYGTPKDLNEHEDIIELIAWGDSVKLRFGDKPEDCPFLWNYMRKYVEQTARIFDGVRLDNCHSTPLPVAEYLLDCARRIRPDLYIVAELFTNSDITDNIFVNRLGITSLIREAMSAWDSHEEGRLVYRYGGSPVGSFYQPSIRPLVPSVAHALFLDLTHDNPSPVEKRSVFDLLPSTALVNMACCASGSNRGYDELRDQNLALENLRYVTKKSGIIAAKRAINDLHFTLGKEGYNQVYVDQMDSDIVAVTRHRPDTHQSYILIAFTAFGHPNEDAGIHQRNIKPLKLEGVLDEIVLEATLSHINVKTGGSKFAKWEKFVRNSKWIHGLSEYQVRHKTNIQVTEVSLPEAMTEAVETVCTLIHKFSITKEAELALIVNRMTLADLNRTIYRCDQEERDEGFGFGTYYIPNFGPLV